MNVCNSFHISAALKFICSLSVLHLYRIAWIIMMHAQLCVYLVWNTFNFSPIVFKNASKDNTLFKPSMFVSLNIYSFHTIIFRFPSKQSEDYAHQIIGLSIYRLNFGDYHSSKWNGSVFLQKINILMNRTFACSLRLRLVARKKIDSFSCQWLK